MLFDALLADTSPAIFLHPLGRDGIHEINKDRIFYGEFHHLYPVLRQNPERFRNYLRMDIETFDYILEKIESRITKNWTNFNKSPIFPAERLVLTLR